MDEQGPPKEWPNSDAYLVTYEDGTEETVWGYTIRYIADVTDDRHEGHGNPVKIERLDR